MVNSKIVNHFDLENDILSIEGRFRYRFFHAFEQSDEAGLHINSISGGEKVSARYVYLKWAGNNILDSSLSTHGMQSILHKVNFFYSVDLQKDFSIYSVRSQDSLQEMNQVLSDSTDTASKYDYMFCLLYTSPSPRD